MERRKPLRRTPIQRKTPINAKKSESRKTQRPPRRTPARAARTPDGHPACESWTLVRKILFNRAGGRCELCGTKITLEAMEGHHRQSRSVGPDCPGNGLGLCASCHHGEVHEQPEWAMLHGWITSRHHRQPCTQPVYLDRHGWVRLGCDGTIEPLAGPPAASSIPSDK